MQTCLLLLSLFISAIFVAKRHTKEVFFRKKKQNNIHHFYKKFVEPAFAQQKKLQPQLKPFLLFTIYFQ